jgi:hypothetical protein
MTTMGMSHENCNHPRTPAGRAACRKLGGPGAASTTPTVAKVTTKTATGKRTRGGWPAVGDERKRYLRAEHDLADVPHVFTAAIRYAWTKNWDVVATRMIPTEKTVQITSEHGCMALVWKDANPHAVGAMWRPINSSITSKLATVNVGLDRLNGDVQ